MNDIDLCYWHEAGGLKMMAVTHEWQSTAFAAKEAIKNIVPEVMTKYPGRFADEKAAQQFFTVVHFRNMERNANSFGQEYPFGSQSDAAAVRPQP
jgi:hypothetical protein